MSLPLMIYLKTTDTCQLNCAHCFTNGKNGKKGFFNPKQSLDFFKRLKDYFPDQEDITFSFHGGEPFLCPTDLMFEFWEGIKPIWPHAAWTAQTNLTYKLTDDKIKVLKDICLGAWGTSWDYHIRWTNSKQEELWRENVKYLADHGHEITVMISLTQELITQKEPIDIINELASLGVKHINFERVTANGNALTNIASMPVNLTQDKWLLKMWHQSLEHQTWKYIHNMFFDPLITALNSHLHSATHCRNCEQKIFTINADGMIGGCPNGAMTNTYGSIHDDIEKIIKSPGRLCNIAKELSRNPNCFSCPVFDICNGDCHQLSWQEDICAAPKSLMLELKQLKQKNELSSNFQFAYD